MIVDAVSAAFAGRAKELVDLEAALSRTIAGSSACVLIGGDAGVGKSRLIAEFLDRFAVDARVIVGNCVELGAEGLPFAPFTAALRGLIGQIGMDGVTALLGDSARWLARLLPDLGRPEGDFDSVDARARLFQSVLTLLANLAAERTLVLVIEDAHWADRSSRELLDFLVRNQRAGAAFLVLVSYRGEELPRTHPLRSQIAELTRIPWVQRLELPPLARDAVTAQMQAILGHEPGSDLVDTVYRRSQGIPLYVEALLESGVEVGAGLPELLADLLLTRIVRLPESTQRVVQAVSAAAAGRMQHPLLAAVTGLDEAALSAALRPAVTANVLVVDGDSYVFRHALIGEATYRSLLPGERIRLHVRYAEALEADQALAGEHGTAVELAQHWYAAQNHAKALTAAWTAAAEARKALAYAEQGAMLDRVLQLWRRVRTAPDLIGADRAAVLAEAVEAAAWAGDPARAEGFATKALAELDQDSDRVRAALLLIRRARMRRHLGTVDDVSDLGEAVRLAPADHPVRATALAALAVRLIEIPQFDEANAAATEAIDIAARTGTDSAAAEALLALAAVEAGRGDLAAAQARLAGARALAKGPEAPFLRIRSFSWESILLESHGQSERAAQAARRGIDAAKESFLGHTPGADNAISLVTALISLGRWNEATDAIADGLELSPPTRFRMHMVCLRGLLALERGDAALAQRAIDDARGVLAEGTCLAQDLLVAAHLEIEVELAQGHVASASALVRRLLAGSELAEAPHFGWPLLVLGARVAEAARAAGDAKGLSLLADLEARSATLRVVGPVQAAQALTFAAEHGHAELGHDRAAWDAAVDAWERVSQPFPTAQALFRAAECALAGDRDRAIAAARLRRAAGLAADIGAVRLRAEIEQLARRARITLAPSEPTAQPLGGLGLTRRELEVLRLVAAGCGNRDIATELFISAKTASAHVSNILGKLGVATRGEAAAAAYRLNLVDDDSRRDAGPVPTGF
ncbi:helix-turn-helix transcriptional regulator [Kribbella sp. ALI-6-A]|uniref:helix-turn-helix transcriptional regulator n=1 Tax=Kribbella sp. ALI-6-A TaxID=1933817 RepID=UPI000A03E8B6|nr:LuxR family transcriptional regulator [Kribbella sp. ALI-6-A]